MSEKIKACPCCGNHDVRIMEKYYQAWMPLYYVACTSCGMRTREFREKEEAIKRWNKRVSSWIRTSERLPDNANKPGAFCPRYQVITPYGITEGWFRPYEHKVGGRWYALIWFMHEPYYPCNIDMIHGDIPKVVENIDVLAWMPLPDSPEVEE